MPLGPETAVKKLTATLATGALDASRTVACNGMANGVLTTADCPSPAVAVIDPTPAWTTVNWIPLVIGLFDAPEAEIVSVPE